MLQGKIIYIDGKTITPTEFIEKIISKILPTKSGIYKFPDIFLRASHCFRLSKKETWKILKKLAKLGIITIIPYHGIRINRKQKNEK